MPPRIPGTQYVTLEVMPGTKGRLNAPSGSGRCDRADQAVTSQRFLAVLDLAPDKAPCDHPPMATEPLLPTCFKLDYGGFPGGYVRLTLRDGQLWFARAAGWPTETEQPVEPSLEDWQQFWDAQRHTDLWHWPRTCRGGESVYDGTEWSVHIVHGGRTARSQGSNPYADGPEPSGQFKRFLQSVEALIGGPLIP